MSLFRDETMNDKELRLAIKDSFDMLLQGSCALQKPIGDHIISLLAEQLRRATNQTGDTQ